MYHYTERPIEEALRGLFRVARVDEDQECAMIEIDGKYHIVSIDIEARQVYSVLPVDSPKEGQIKKYAYLTERGIQAVSSGRSKAAAQAQWRKHIAVPEKIPSGIDF